VQFRPRETLGHERWVYGLSSFHDLPCTVIYALLVRARKPDENPRLTCAEQPAAQSRPKPQTCREPKSARASVAPKSFLSPFLRPNCYGTKKETDQTRGHGSATLTAILALLSR